MSTRDERLFGTDGIRGTPGVYPLTDGMLFKIGASAAKLIFQREKKDLRHTVVIGRDTRTSGERLEAIIADSMNYYGVDVLLAGTIPTPGISYLVRHTGADMGIMISASHNKATDNGIKFFTKEGSKLSIQDEQWMEQLILGSLMHSSNGARYRNKGRSSRLSGAFSSYSEFLKSTVSDTNLEGFKIALDCAWGATSSLVSQIFRSLGNEVYAIHDMPKGENINFGGAMNPSILKKTVLKNSADVGFAFDGDGDRVILVDDKGNILDGDYIMAIIGLYLLGKKMLSNNTLVGTIMSNYGLKRAIQEHGGSVIHTKVGDKHVTEELRSKKLNFGGEQSGHIILFDYAPTPDGLLTALQILKIMKETKKPLSSLACSMRKLPQVLVNVKVKDKKPLQGVPAIWQAIEYSERRLKNLGRLSVRYSGTESLARIMVEGEDHNLIQEVAASLQDIFQKELGIDDLEACG